MVAGENAPGENTPTARRVSLRSLATVTTMATLVLIGVGGYTRGSGSGFGCADRWPLCEDGALGGLLPRWEQHMIIEWSHRWLAATVGILALATAIVAWRRYRTQPRVVRPAIVAVVVVGIQAWIGRMIVAEGLDADLVSLHLAVSLIVVGLLTVVAVNAGHVEGLSVGTAPVGDAAAAPNRFSWTVLVAVGAAGTYAVLLAGSYVHDRYVPGWPLVDGRVVPDISDRYLAIHYLHRLLAGLGAVYMVYLALAVRRRGRGRTEVAFIDMALAGYVVNVLLGLTHVVTRVTSSFVVAAHLLVAAVAWAALVAATTEARRHDHPLLARRASGRPDLGDRMEAPGPGTSVEASAHTAEAKPTDSR